MDEIKNIGVWLGQFPVFDLHSCTLKDEPRRPWVDGNFRPVALLPVWTQKQVFLWCHVGPFPNHQDYETRSGNDQDLVGYLKATPGIKFRFAYLAVPRFDQEK